jgi:hypothetical protein
VALLASYDGRTLRVCSGSRRRPTSACTRPPTRCLSCPSNLAWRRVMRGVRLLVFLNQDRALGAIERRAALSHPPGRVSSGGRASCYLLRGVTGDARLRAGWLAVVARYFNRAPEQRHAPDPHQAGSYQSCMGGRVMPGVRCLALIRG